jgi:hypothetical protein
MGAFTHLIPPVEPTVLQLAGRALEASRALSLFLDQDRSWTQHSIDLENGQFDAADAFFAALEAETGIDRDTFRKLGELA